MFDFIKKAFSVKVRCDWDIWLENKLRGKKSNACSNKVYNVEDVDFSASFHNNSTKPGGPTVSGSCDGSGDCSCRH